MTAQSVGVVTHDTHVCVLGTISRLSMTCKFLIAPAAILTFDSRVGRSMKVDAFSKQ